MIEEKTEELLHVSFEYDTISESILCECMFCDNVIPMDATVRYRVGTIPDYISLSKKKKLLKSSKFVCPRCREKIIGNDLKKLSIRECVGMYYDITKVRKNGYISLTKLKDKILVFKNEEYVIPSVSAKSDYSFFYIEGCLVSKDIPFQEEIEFSFGINNSNYDDFMIIDTDFKERLSIAKRMRCEYEEKLALAARKKANVKSYEKCLSAYKKNTIDCFNKLIGTNNKILRDSKVMFYCKKFEEVEKQTTILLDLLDEIIQEV